MRYNANRGVEATPFPVPTPTPSLRSSEVALTPGKFLPTRRTPAISTSDLLERIVRGYRDGFFDTKLEKNGQIDLLACDVDWDSDISVDRRQQRRLAAARKRGGVEDISATNSAAPSAPNSEPGTPVITIGKLAMTEAGAE